ARADLLKQTAELTTASLAVGKAVELEVAAEARDILGDPEIAVKKVRLGVNLQEALALAPKGLVPGAARGTLSVEAPGLRARMSRLTRLEPFDADLNVALAKVNARAAGNDVYDVNLGLNVLLRQAGTIDVALKTSAGKVVAAQAEVENARVDVGV